MTSRLQIYSRELSDGGATVTEAANELGSSHFFSERQRCLAVLPTGFGKSLCYACLPAAFDKILEKEKGYSIVVSSHSSAGLVGRSPTVPDGRSGCKPIWDLF